MKFWIGPLGLWFRRLGVRWVGPTIALVFLFASLETDGSFGPVGQSVQGWSFGTFDFWQRLSNPRETSSDVVVVQITDDDLQKYGRWPWPRPMVAKLIAAVTDADPRVIGVDIIFVDESWLSLTQIEKLLGPAPEEAKFYLAPLDADSVLSAALGQVPTVVAHACGDDQMPRTQAGSEPSEPVSGLRAIKGFVRIGRDIDGVVRTVLQPLPARTQKCERGLVDFSVAVAALGLAGPTAGDAGTGACSDLSIVDPDETASAQQQTPLSCTVSITDRFIKLRQKPPIPMDRIGRLWLDFRAREAIKRIPAHEILSRGPETAALSGKFVLIGLAAAGLHQDSVTTPRPDDDGTPGVVVRAVALDNILTGHILDQPPWGVLAGSLFVVGAAVASAGLFGWRRLSGLVIISVLLIVFPWGASWAAYLWDGTLIQPVRPGIGAFFAFAPAIWAGVARARRDLAQARDEIKREAQEMAAAREIQLGLLPLENKAGEGSRFSPYAVCEPARAVGGDFLDYFRIDDHRLFFMVGDVAGKGLRASLMMALAKAVSATLADRDVRSIGDLMSRANREFMRQAPKAWKKRRRFVTVGAALLDLATGRLEYAVAGHDPPVRAGGGKSAEALVTIARKPFGWDPTVDYPTSEAQLSPGDVIIWCTDGITEAETPDGELFGRERLLGALGRSGDAEAAVGALTAAVEAFRAGHEQLDDVTVLAIQWLGDNPAVSAAGIPEPTGA